jgi:hypothetical protein
LPRLVLRLPRRSQSMQYFRHLDEWEFQCP